MFRSQRRTTFVLATLFTSLLALSGCGGDSGSERTRNAALDTRTCAEGGQCSVGAIGPGGGVVFFDAGSDYEWGRYLEVAPENWANDLNNVAPKWKEKPLTGNNSRTEDPFGQFNQIDATRVPNFNPANNGNGTGKKEWEKVKDYRCGTCITDTIAEYNQGKVSDWYLPNANEMETLIRSKVRKLTNLSYWTATNLPAVMPQMIKWERSGRTSEAWRYFGMFQFSSYYFVPIRAFSATPIAEVAATSTTSTLPPMTTTPPPPTTSVAVTSTTATLPPQVLKAPTNVRVTFDEYNMNVTFDLQRDGAEPDGHIVKLQWSIGENGQKLLKNMNTTSIYIPHFLRGEKVRVTVRSYTTATQPGQIAETDTLTVDVPMKEPEAPPTPPIEPTKETEIPLVISVLNDPVINLPEKEVASEINRDEFVDSVASQLPELTVAKVEVQVVSSSTDDEQKFVDISQNAVTNFAIPADATQVNVRITGTQGEVVEQSKLIVRVNDEGVEVAPSKISQSTDTTTTVKPSEGDSSETTVVSTPGDVSSDDSSGSNPFVWLLIAIVALLLAGFGVRQLRR